MIRIESEAWADMLAHASRIYPNECCGVMLGRQKDGEKVVSRAVPLDNVSAGPKTTRYEVRPEDLLRVEKLARSERLTCLGIYHSHPDCEAYFSATDLENSCPWYSFVVLSIRRGRFDHATSWLPDVERNRAEPEDLSYPVEAKTDGDNPYPYAAEAVRR